ncbi:MAG: ABC transporter permease DevC [Rhodovarius sp.]|nr:ABC transporter permease DevC [Rhodovarius sp.]MDW8313936.1 ABC transporter permease DevC [Rhodovarius sp.]
MNELSAPARLLPAGAELAGPPAMDSPPPPGLAREAWLAMRLAWRQLRADRARLAAAIAGVMFAGVLVFMQLGFQGALFDSATRMVSALHGDLFLKSPLTQVSFRSEQIPRTRAYQALADPDVEYAVPIYLAQAVVRNPATGSRRAAQIVGLDVTAGAVQVTGLAEIAHELTRPDTFAFDLRSRPEFGPIAQLFRERGPYEVQIGNRAMQLVGLIEIGPSFGADGNVVMSETNFRRIFPRQFSNTDLVALRLRPGAEPVQVAERLRALLPGDVRVMTQPELVAAERSYWEKGTSIGFIFGFGSVMGLVVGMVIVYQILFADIAGHLSEYATLKAMGYSNGYLARVVLGAAMILAVLGFVPCFGLSLILYDVVAAGTYLPLAMPIERAVGVFLLIFFMCFAAGLLAMRKLREANPADMF